MIALQATSGGRLGLDAAGARGASQGRRWPADSARAGRGGGRAGAGAALRRRRARRRRTRPGTRRRRFRHRSTIASRALDAAARQVRDAGNRNAQVLDAHRRGDFRRFPASARPAWSTCRRASADRTREPSLARYRSGAAERPRSAPGERPHRRRLYFATLGLTPRAGRLLDAGRHASRRHVAVVNEAFVADASRRRAGRRPPDSRRRFAATTTATDSAADDRRRLCRTSRRRRSTSPRHRRCICRSTHAMRHAWRCVVRTDRPLGEMTMAMRARDCERRCRTGRVRLHDVSAI